MLHHEIFKISERNMELRDSDISLSTHIFSPIPKAVERLEIEVRTLG